MLSGDLAKVLDRLRNLEPPILIRCMWFDTANLKIVCHTKLKTELKDNGLLGKSIELYDENKNHLVSVNISGTVHILTTKFNSAPKEYQKLIILDPSLVYENWTEDQFIELYTYHGSLNFYGRS